MFSNFISRYIIFFSFFLISANLTTLYAQELVNAENKIANLKESLAGFPPSIQANISKDPILFLNLVSELEKSNPPSLLLVTKTKPIPNAKSFTPRGLIQLKNYSNIKFRVQPTYLTKETANALDALFLLAQKDDISLLVSSGFRDYGFQKVINDGWVEKLGQVEADKVSAKPGTSEHQLGTTIDFYPVNNNFAKTEASPWLEQNAWKEGFSSSYPKDSKFLTGYGWEPWHYRYIGKKAVQLQRLFFENNQYWFLKWWNEER